MASPCLTQHGLGKDSHLFSIYFVGCRYAFFKTNGKIFCFGKLKQLILGIVLLPHGF